jgi:hypothetical protein
MMQIYNHTGQNLRIDEKKFPALSITEFDEKTALKLKAMGFSEKESERKIIEEPEHVPASDEEGED